jgi:uncharacterized membrane protein YkvI
MKELNSRKLAVTYTGCFLGAGFLSGQELWQFFGTFGNWGYLGFLISALLFFAFGVLLVRLTQMTGISEMDRILIPWNIPWLRGTVGLIEAFFLFTMVTVMTAGAAAMIRQLTGLPVWVGGVLFGALVAVVAIFGVEGMVKVFSALVPVLAVATVLFAGAAWIHFGTAGITRLTYQNTNPLMPNWVIAAVTYVAYNLMGSIGIVTPVGPLVKQKKTVYVGISAACLILMAIAGSVLTSVAVDSSAAAAEVPMVAVACVLSPVLGTCYGIMLLLGMFGNSLASLVALETYLQQKVPRLRPYRKPLLAVIAAVAFIGSLAGFSEIIAVAFPIFGYISIAFLVCLVIHLCQCKKREKSQKTDGELPANEPCVETEKSEIEQ